MASEGAVSSISSVNLIEEQGPGKSVAAAVSEALAASSQAANLQHFQVSLERAAEDGAVELQSHRLSHQAVIGAGASDRAATHFTATIEVRPSINDGGMTRQMAFYLDGFQQRAAAFQSGSTVQGANDIEAVQDAVKIDGSHQHKPNSDGAGNVQGAAANTNANTETALRLLERSFAFAIEAHVVTNVSSQSEKVLNSLLKGQ